MAKGVYLHKPLSLAHRQAISRANLGRVVSQETRRKIGAANAIAQKGKKMPDHVKAILRAVHEKLGTRPPVMRGPANPKWKGGHAVIKLTAGYRFSRANSILKHKYGITLIEYEAMVTRQRGKCKICGKMRKLYIDHDHATKRIRGLLCRECNSGIGFLGEDIKVLNRAILYLRAI